MSIDVRLHMPKLQASESQKGRTVCCTILMSELEYRRLTGQILKARLHLPVPDILRKQVTGQIVLQ